MIFGIVYLKTRQNLAMIEKGMNPKEFANRPAPYKNLKWALLLIGSGLGLFLAYVLDNYVLQTNQGGFHHHDGNEAIYFSLIAIGGGLGFWAHIKLKRNGGMRIRKRSARMTAIIRNLTRIINNQPISLIPQEPF